MTETRGRKHKGERKKMTVRIEVAIHEAVFKKLALTNENFNDYVIRLIQEDLKEK